MSLKQYEDWYMGMFAVVCALVAAICAVWGIVVATQVLINFFK